MPAVALLLFLGMFQTSADPLSVPKSEVNAGSTAKAETEVREYLGTHGDSPEGHFLLAYILFRETKARESLAELTSGARYQTPSATDLRVAGADYVLLGDYNSADKWFTKANEFDSGSALGWYYLGRTKYNENRFEEALAAFRRCLMISPKHVKAEDNLGLSLQGLGRANEAQQAFLTAIEWDREAQEKGPWPYIDFGNFLLDQNQPDRAITYLLQAIELDGNIAQAHRLIGKAYVAIQQPEKGQQELERAVTLEPGNAGAHYVLGQIYQKQGRTERAKQEFARYSQLSAAHPKEEIRDLNQ